MLTTIDHRNRRIFKIYWNNFNLGNELNIAGTFIYNAIDAFDKIRDFKYSADLFEVLYNLAVGIERLMQTAVILTEFNLSKANEFDKNLKIHNHMVLRDKIQTKHTFVLETPHNMLLQLLSEFFSSIRYYVYNVSSVYLENFEQIGFLDFINSNLRDSSVKEDLLNNNRIKRFFGRTISKITSQLYEILKIEADRHNIHDYELKQNSKAARIFSGKELDFNKDNIYKKEILLHLIANLPKDVISKCNPLLLESYNTETYINALFNHENYAKVWGELETIYEDELKTKYNTSIKQRLQDMEHFELFFDIDNNEFDLEEE